MIALQVVRTSLGFHLSERMGSSSPSPVYKGPLRKSHPSEVGWVIYLIECNGEQLQNTGPYLRSQTEVAWWLTSQDQCLYTVE